MALNSNNIVVGAARIFLGPTGTTRPAAVAGQRYRTTLLGTGGTWTEIGFTTDGFQVATDPTFTDIEVDQSLDSAKVIKTGMSVNVSTTMVEATLDNLLMAWGQAASTLSSTGTDRSLTIEAGQLGDAPLERGLIAVSNAPGTTPGTYGERVYHLYRVLSVEASTHTLSRTDPTGIPVTFRALPDDTTLRYGLLLDRQGPFTS